MPERWFVVPGWQGQGSRSKKVGVKYVDLDVWEGSPQLAGIYRRQWRFDHQDHRVVLIKTEPESDQANLDILAAQPDVFEIVDLAATIRNREYNLLRNWLRSMALPVDWLVRNVTTYGEAIDEIIEMSTLTRRYYRMHRQSLTLSHGSPDDTADADKVNKVAQAAQSMDWGQPVGSTVGELIDWGRTRGRIPPNKRRI